MAAKDPRLQGSGCRDGIAGEHAPVLRPARAGVDLKGVDEPAAAKPEDVEGAQNPVDVEGIKDICLAVV
ncbi:MAG: hypothetical protein UT91_C0027G0021 [Parcubacteria group bacterium GW2011_GWA2_40_23]|nr:MAG: hypothetical protein UT91_C0027G0021 [Parcubacteria group bacterium GW2011_GWA2_40_23]